MEKFTPDQISKLSNLMTSLALSAQQIQTENDDEFAKGYHAGVDFANRRLAKLDIELDELYYLLCDYLTLDLEIPNI